MEREYVAQFEKAHRRYTVSGLVLSQTCIIAGVTLHDTVKVVDCHGGVISIRGKCKIVLVDRCRGVSVRMDGAICGAELVHCSTINLETKAAVPVIAIDNSDIVDLVLGGEAEVITASSQKVSLRTYSPHFSEDRDAVSAAEPCSSQAYLIPTTEELGLLPLGRQLLTVFSPRSSGPLSTVPFKRNHLCGPDQISSAPTL